MRKILVPHYVVQRSPNCGLLDGSIAIDCDNPLNGGANDRLILYNFSEIAGYTPNGTNPQLIEAITLASGKTGYTVEGKNNSVEPSQLLVKQKYGEVYDHEIRFKIFTSSPDVKKRIEAMVKGRYVAVIQNNFQGANGNAEFELYGRKAGLVVKELKRTLVDADTQGAYDIVLATPEATKEPNLPNSIFITSRTATLAMIEGTL